MPKNFEFTFDEMFNPMIKALKELGGSGSIEEIEEKIKKVRRYTIEARLSSKQLTPGAKKLSNSVAKAIRDAIKRIRKQDAAFADHLNGSLEFGLNPVYKPRNDVIWRVEY